MGYLNQCLDATTRTNNTELVISRKITGYIAHLNQRISYRRRGLATCRSSTTLLFSMSWCRYTMAVQYSKSHVVAASKPRYL